MKMEPALQEYVDKLRDLYSDNIEKIILFGSRAREEVHGDSDIDLLIVVGNSSKTLKDQITDLAFDIILKYGVDLEPSIYESDEWAELTRIPTSFTYCVLNEGREL